LAERFICLLRCLSLKSGYSSTIITNKRQIKIKNSGFDSLTEKILLNGEYILKELCGGLEIKTSVPGYITRALMDAGIIEDLFENDKSGEAFEVEYNDYSLEHTFTCKKPEAGKHVFLCFDGIDTLATIFLNETEIAKTNNMFMQYRFEVGALLKEGQNSLKVILHSASKEADRLYDESPYKYNACYQQSRIFLRKAQYCFGWDWCPRIVPAGIWRDVYLEYDESARIYGGYVSGFNDGNITVEVQIESFVESDLTLACTVDNKAVSKKLHVVKGENTVSINVQIDNPKLWYPVGYGEQPLYDFSLILFDEQSPIAETHFKSGLRKVEIIRNKDKYGESFVFSVNGKEIFARGANYIPTDMFPLKYEEGYLNKIIELALEQNMNMLRVWGGGYYEFDEFYTKCDEAGILIWQDFMFCCSEIPDDREDYRENVKLEADYVIKALRYHPSIILWCGSNENTWAMASWWESEDKEFLGRKIYQNVLPQAVERLDKMTPYWESSPFGGENPNEHTVGDCHYWGVWADWKDIEEYKVIYPRFASEFGMQSMPAIKTINEYVSEQNKIYPSNECILRDRQEFGTEKLMRYCLNYFGIPKSYDDFIRITQLTQGKAMKVAAESWRSQKPLSGGLIFWQYNDCWPGPSQSAVDYRLRKKAVAYFAKRFFENALITAEHDKNKVKVNFINDSQEDILGKITVSCVGFDGTLSGKTEFDFNCKVNSVFSKEFDDLSIFGIDTKSLKPYPKNVYSYIEGVYLPKDFDRKMLFITAEFDGKTVTNELLFDRERTLELQKPDIEITVSGEEVTLKSAVPVLYATLEAENEIEFSDNYFCMEPNKEYKLKASGDIENISVTDLTQMLYFLK